MLEPSLLSRASSSKRMRRSIRDNNSKVWSLATMLLLLPLVAGPQLLTAIRWSAREAMRTALLLPLLLLLKLLLSPLVTTVPWMLWRALLLLLPCRCSRWTRRACCHRRSRFGSSASALRPSWGAAAVAAIVALAPSVIVAAAASAAVKKAVKTAAEAVRWQVGALLLCQIGWLL